MAARVLSASGARLSFWLHSPLNQVSVSMLQAFQVWKFLWLVSNVIDEAVGKLLGGICGESSGENPRSALI